MVLYINIPQKNGLGFAPTVCGTASTNTGLTAFFWQYSPDGTNWTTDTPLVTFCTGNGVTAVKTWTNVPPVCMDNAARLRLATITNSAVNTSGLWITNVLFLKQY
jgi:hypothetical protein